MADTTFFSYSSLWTDGRRHKYSTGPMTGRAQKAAALNPRGFDPLLSISSEIGSHIYTFESDM